MRKEKADSKNPKRKKKLSKASDHLKQKKIKRKEIEDDSEKKIEFEEEENDDDENENKNENDNIKKKNKKSKSQKTKTKNKHKKKEDELSDDNINSEDNEDENEINGEEQEENENKEDEIEDDDDLVDNKKNKSNDKEVQFLPCREQQQKQIYDYIKDGLNTNGDYSSLYIAGMPGTGKTASVLQVIKKLQYEYKNNLNNTKNFIFLQINGMKYTNPSNVFKAIYNYLFMDKKQKLVKTYIQALDHFFANRDAYKGDMSLQYPENPHLILFVDEIDCLINRKQNLLYSLFNWTKYPQAKLIVISISNTLDLPNRLNPKVSSRMGKNKIMFSAYGKDDLYKIINFKLDDADLFSRDAMRFCSTKVAAVNGDLRRVLQICAKAKEIFFLEQKNNNDNDNNDINVKNEKIDRRHIMQACSELFDSKFIGVIKKLSLISKILLTTILYLMKKNNNNKIKIEDIYKTKNIFIKKITEEDINMEDYLLLSWDLFQTIIFRLHDLMLITFNEGSEINFINFTVSIKFYADEFMTACTGDTPDDLAFKPALVHLNQLLEEN